MFKDNCTLFITVYEVFHTYSMSMLFSTVLFCRSKEYGTHHSYVLVVHTLRVAENEILKLDFPAKRH
jgi:hypothetical protein